METESWIKKSNNSMAVPVSEASCTYYGRKSQSSKAKAKTVLSLYIREEALPSSEMCTFWLEATIWLLL